MTVPSRYQQPNRHLRSVLRDRHAAACARLDARGLTIPDAHHLALALATGLVTDDVPAMSRAVPAGTTGWPELLRRASEVAAARTLRTAVQTAAADLEHPLEPAAVTHLLSLTAAADLTVEQLHAQVPVELGAARRWTSLSVDRWALPATLSVPHLACELLFDGVRVPVGRQEQVLVAVPAQLLASLNNGWVPPARGGAVTAADRAVGLPAMTELIGRLWPRRGGSLADTVKIARLLTAPAGAAAA